MSYTVRHIKTALCRAVFYCADRLTLNDRDYRREDDDCRRPADDRRGHAVRHPGRERRHRDRRGHGWQTRGRDYHPDPVAHRSGDQQGVRHRT
ncbi:hypothetical protein L2216_26745, partial [Xanthomonas perforans]|nr:hypothetical protein [Xanthomonas perforans]